MSSFWICIDASLVVRLVSSPGDEQIRALWEQWDVDGNRIIAPALLYYEVISALYQYQRHGYLSEKAIGLALEAALALPVQVQNDPRIHLHALKLAQRFSLPATYDAHYLAAAEIQGAEFWTGDKRLARLVQTDLPWVRLLA